MDDVRDPTLRDPNFGEFGADIPHDYSYDMDIGTGREHASGKIQQTESPRPLVTWKNRRRMAWVCLITMISFVSVLVFDMGIGPERVESLEPIITTFLYVLGGVIVAYMGFTSLPFFGMGGK